MRSPQKLIAAVFLAALPLSAQRAGAVFGGFVAAPNCGTEPSSEQDLQYVCAASSPGEYVIRFPKSLLTGEASSSEVMETSIELLNLGEPTVDWDVVRREGAQPYRYSYALSNGPNARRAIWSWALVVPSEDDSTMLQHPFWRSTSPASLATNAPIAPQAAMVGGPELRRSVSLGKFARWTTSLDEHPVKPGETLSLFVADSSFRPGWTTAYASAGRGIEIPFEMPDEVYRELAILQRPENEQSIVLTIGPKFGPDVSSQWIAADWNLGVQKMIANGNLPRESAYISELLYALELVATADSQLALALRGKPAAGIEEKVHRAVSLALGTQD